jgi:glycine cleavage system aminomethyltransferase T
LKDGKRYIPAEQAVDVYRRICEAGKEFGMLHAGLRTLGSCRMEKAYRDYGHDIDNTDNLIGVGLSFTADTEKKVPFIGREEYLKGLQDVFFFFFFFLLLSLLSFSFVAVSREKAFGW